MADSMDWREWFERDELTQDAMQDIHKRLFGSTDRGLDETVGKLMVQGEVIFKGDHSLAEQYAKGHLLFMRLLFREEIDMPPTHPDYAPKTVALAIGIRDATSEMLAAYPGSGPLQTEH